MMQIDIEQKLADLSTRSERERKRFYARGPKRISDTVATVIAKRGYAAAKASEDLTGAWRQAASSVLGEGAIAAQTCVTGLSRGRLEVNVANHVVMQEINFHRPALLAAMQQQTPTARIQAIRFRVGKIH